jgi:hypothetical protein
MTAGFAAVAGSGARGAFAACAARAGTDAVARGAAGPAMQALNAVKNQTAGSHDRAGYTRSQIAIFALLHCPKTRNRRAHSGLAALAYLLDRRARLRLARTSASSIKKSINCAADTPLASHNLGNMDTAVNPGSVLISFA